MLDDIKLLMYEKFGERLRDSNEVVCEYCESTICSDEWVFMISNSSICEQCMKEIFGKLV